MTIIFIVIGAIVLIGLWLIGVYNGLISNRNQADEAWSDISIQLKRRYDLIPNLIETVKGYAKHEKTAFEDVTKARATAMGAKNLGDKVAAEGALSGSLMNLMAVAEAYPDLKANENFKALQDELSDTENKIQAARRFYNGVVRDFNIKIQIFPTNMIANLLGFIARPFFELEADEAAAVAQPVKVDFSERVTDEPNHKLNNKPTDESSDEPTEESTDEPKKK